MEDNLNKFLVRRKGIIQRVDQLPDRHKLAFAIACCGRLAKSCQMLSLVYKTDIHKVIDSVVTQLWDHLDTEPLSQTMMEKLRQDLVQVEEESEEFSPTLYAELASYMASTLQTVLNACSDMSTNHIEDVVKMIEEILRHYLHSVNYPSNEYLPSDEQSHFDNWIREAPLFLAEYRRQRQDLEILEKNAELSSDVINQLRFPKEQIGIDLIRSGLIPEKGIVI